MKKTVVTPENTREKNRRAVWVLAGLTAILAVLFFCSLLLGRYRVPAWDTAKILFSKILPIEKTWDTNGETAVLNIRLPRILLACLVGCGLAVSGTAYQSVFRNPMAAPDILGASSGACFGAALAILLGLPKLAVTALAFVCGLITVTVVYAIGRRTRGNPIVGLLLAGIMVGSLCSAGTSCLKLVADPSEKLPAITYWLMGSLSGARMKELGLIAIPMLAGIVPLLLLRWRLNLLTLDEEEALSLGVDTDKLRLVTVLCATLLTAASVSAAGMIGWVGLVIPHLSRRLAGNNCRYLIPVSMLFGAVFLLAVDDISRNLLAVEIPIGILTAFVGAPFFLCLMTGRGNAL